MELTYADYLHVDQLLELQKPRSDPPNTTKRSSSSFTKPMNSWFKLPVARTR